METLNKLYLELSTLVSPDTKTARELALEAENASLQREIDARGTEIELRDDEIAKLRLAEQERKAQTLHLERTKTLAINLVKAMEAVHASEDFKGVWALAQVHGVEYKGPTYKKELAELKKEVFA